MLRFRARNQDILRDFKFESPKFLFAGEVLRRLACSAPADKREVTLGIESRKFFFGMRIDPRAIAAENMEKQQFRGERVRRDACSPQLRERFTKRGADDERRRLRFHPKSVSF